MTSHDVHLRDCFEGRMNVTEFKAEKTDILLPWVCEKNDSTSCEFKAGKSRSVDPHNYLSLKLALSMFILNVTYNITLR